MSNYIALSEPYLKGNEKKYLNQCLNDNWVSTNGKFINRFEEKLKNFLRIKNVLLCMNGTSALDIAIKTLGIKSNEEILVPSITFIAPINAVRYNNCSPIFFDCDQFCNIDINKLIKFIEKYTFVKNNYTYNIKTKKKISALILVHVFGNAVDLDKIVNLCKKRNIKIIEDASESLGTYYIKGKYKKKFTGTIGDIGCFSFNGNKIITSGAGGAIVSHNAKLISKAKYLINQAKDDSFEYIHNNIGYNLRISNIQAAIGLAQIENIKRILKKRKQIKQFYLRFLNDNKYFQMVPTPDYSINNNWLNVITFNKNISLQNINKICKIFSNKKIQVRKIWYPNHLQKPYKSYQNFNIKNAINIQKYSLCLPSSNSLNLINIKKISQILIENCK